MSLKYQNKRKVLEFDKFQKILNRIPEKNKNKTNKQTKKKKQQTLNPQNNSNNNNQKKNPNCKWT